MRRTAGNDTPSLLAASDSRSSVDDAPKAGPTWPLGANEERLRRRVGDAYDSLLASGGVSGWMALRLPCRNGGPIPSFEAVAAYEGEQATGPLSLKVFRVPVLTFGSADAVDLLTARPRLGGQDVRMGASLVYWSRVAHFVLEMLAAQYFVPATHRVRENEYRGYWRAVLNGREAFPRVSALVESMPPVCRCQADVGEPIQAAGLVEDFLWSSVDALVRRCLEGDELAHALHEYSGETCTAPIRWLRSLVRSDSTLEGSVEQQRHICAMVGTWLAKLEPASPQRAFRTCFRIHPPSTSGDEGSDGMWRVNVQVQLSDDTGVVLDAESLLDGDTAVPALLRYPLDNVYDELRSDIAKAARHFPALAVCAEPSGPLECHLDLAEAYAFLRDAAPMLESEGFRVITPKWWREDRPRLRMWLNIRPTEPDAKVGASSMGLDAVVNYDWRIAVGDHEVSAEEIARLAAEKAPLIKLHGRWTELQPGDATAALNFLQEHRGGRMTVFEALRQCYLADDLDTGVPVAGLRAHGWIDELLGGNIPQSRLQRLKPPKGFKGELRPYQLRGLEWLAFLTKLGLGACLADDMGLGKTIQMIALWLSERESGESPGPTLLVVPMSLVGNWQREIARFAPSLKAMVHHGVERLTGREFVEQVSRHDVVISTYGLIHRDLDHLAAVDWYRIVLDEAQNIKNPAAKQATAIRRVRAVHRMALTGTPVENRLSELWSIIDFLNPGYLGGATEFRRRFAVPIERYHDSDRAQRLRHLIRPFVLRRLKKDPAVEVDLPEKMEMKVFCNLTREQAGLYEATVGEMLGQIDHAGGIQRRGLILATLIKLKQVCNHPAHLLGDGSNLPHRSGKCDRLTEMLEEALAEGDRALVFTQFRVMGDLLVRLLEEKFGRVVLFFHGGTTRPRRDAIVEQFQDPESDKPILLLSLKAGGYGLNLTAASHVFHFDRWWNPAVEDQATDRAHRIGQVHRVQVHKFVCVGTLEERIDTLLEQKRNLADNILGGGEDWLTDLSTEKLREVFALSRDAVAED